MVKINYWEKISILKITLALNNLSVTISASVI